MHELTDKMDTAAATDLAAAPPVPATSAATAARPREIGGPKGPEPTRYGDWEKQGRCIDF